MAKSGHAWAHGIGIVLGIALMVAGVVGGRAYAGIFGLLIATVNIGPWRRAMRTRRGDAPGPPKSA
jgi:hypothetical protein